PVRHPVREAPVHVPRRGPPGPRVHPPTPAQERQQALDNTLGGTLGGSGNFTITGLFTWNKGTMKGPGTTFANGGISLDGGTLDGRRLDNAGTATWPSDSGGIGLGL